MKTYGRFEEQLDAFANLTVNTDDSYLKMSVAVPIKMAVITKRTGSWMEPRECMDTGVSIQTPYSFKKPNHVVKLITSHYNDRAIHGRKWNSELDTSVDKENIRKEGRMCRVINKWRNSLMEKEYIDKQIE